MQTPKKTTTGKDVFKDEIPFSPKQARDRFIQGGYDALYVSKTHPVLYISPEQIPQQFTGLKAKDSYFGSLPRIWARATAHNRMIGETCVSLGMLPPDDLKAMSLRPVGLNFMAKGAFWEHGHIQVPTSVASLTPIFMNTLAYWKANLPDARLWPAVEAVFKISSDFVEAGKTAQDPFAVQRGKGQGAGWHTDDDRAEEAATLRETGVIARADPDKPTSNALAFLKQRMIFDNAVPTFFSDSWHFAEMEKEKGKSLKVEGYPLINGYPPRQPVKPTFFPVGTPVSFTINNLHSPRIAETDGQRMSIVCSGTINWGNFRRLQGQYPKLKWENFSTEAPKRLLVPQRWLG